ncbi:hypothetical protein QCA50_012450 [Cerrena zonata]|uniref:Uncharacterized protein n=1 Tax=Cerrena zonata TaxID=2478898 RepID=A0AAW0FS79_9APHY
MSQSRPSRPLPKVEKGDTVWLAETVSNISRGTKMQVIDFRTDMGQTSAPPSSRDRVLNYTLTYEVPSTADVTSTFRVLPSDFTVAGQTGHLGVIQSGTKATLKTPFDTFYTYDGQSYPCRIPVGTEIIVGSRYSTGKQNRPVGNTNVKYEVTATITHRFIINTLLPSTLKRAQFSEVKI